ncbi:MAG: hypothetical protein KJZ80_11270 [Hyphomicrobiaceae bacterium]|nr:hypothetical protein [Hyphomicrobiaceae bacterium]
MSRLDSFIARMMAQKILLDAAAAELRAAGDHRPGPAIELGLGNGRTFDHLREALPSRRIVAFDRSLEANPRSVPPAEDLVLGEIEQTAPEFARRFGATGALLHADLGNGIPADEIRLHRWLPGAVLALARPGALVVSSTRLEHASLLEEPLPPGVAAGRYHSYRRA